MGKPSASAADLAIALLSGQFSGVAASAGIACFGKFNISLWGGTGTVQIERSFDGGTTWIPLSKDYSGAIASYNVTAAAPVSLIADEPESGVLYRLNCTAWTSAVSYRISR